MAKTAGGGARILITAGPTAEDIDPVRYITNRSSGRMGLELALAAKRAGATPLLVLGPTALAVPPGIEVAPVRSAADMCSAVLDRLAWADALVMAAAVADYTPAEPLAGKLRKKDGDLLLRLKRTPDILRAVAARPERAGMVVVGFSLDVGMNAAEGERKMRDKNLDMIVVNTVASFGSDEILPLILTPAGREDCGKMGKSGLADMVISRILERLGC